MTVLSKHDALLLDLDGTVWEGGRPLSNVVDVINTCGVPAVYVTNNASRSPQAVAKMLADIGLTAGTEQIVTSAQAVLQLAGEEVPAGAKLLIIGADSLRDLAREMGFKVVSSADDKPAAVVQGFDRSVGWEHLTEGALAHSPGSQVLCFESRYLSAD